MVDDTLLPDRHVAEFLDLARAARFYFELSGPHLTMRMINPDWEMWRHLRFLLDEIGEPRVERYLREKNALRRARYSAG